MKISDNSYIIILSDIILFLLILTLSSKPLLLLTASLLVSLFLVRNKNDWYVYLTAIIVAMVMEPTAVYFGAWQYPHPDFFSVPSWIFIMWGVLAVSLYKLSSKLKNKL